MFIVFTRPDDSPVGVNSDDVVSLASVPKSGATGGPLTEGTRIVFRNKTHQDVKELFDVVVARLNGIAAGGAVRSVRALAPRKKVRASR
jgi:hypothetical protein